MYGGHITDDWDRRLCVSYLEELMQPDLVDGELQLAPGRDSVDRSRMGVANWDWGTSLGNAGRD